MLFSNSGQEKLSRNKLCTLCRFTSLLVSTVNCTVHSRVEMCRWTSRVPTPQSRPEIETREEREAPTEHTHGPPRRVARATRPWLRAASGVRGQREIRSCDTGLRGVGAPGHTSSHARRVRPRISFGARSQSMARARMHAAPPPLGLFAVGCGSRLSSRAPRPLHVRRRARSLWLPPPARHHQRWQRVRGAARWRRLRAASYDFL